MDSVCWKPRSEHRWDLHDRQPVTSGRVIIEPDREIFQGRGVITKRMNIVEECAHEKRPGLRHAQEVMAQCEHCIAYREYPAGKCCAVQAQKNGIPYLVKDMEKCPGIPTLQVNDGKGMSKC